MTSIISSLVRVVKTLIMSVACSFLFLFLRLIEAHHLSMFHGLVFLIFLVGISVDSYRFSSLYSGLYDTVFGLVLPAVICFGCAFVGYFFFPETLFDFLFLPLRVFEGFGFLSIHSLLATTAISLLTIFVMGWIGSMHPIDFEEEYF